MFNLWLFFVLSILVLHSTGPKKQNHEEALQKDTYKIWSSSKQIWNNTAIWNYWECPFKSLLFGWQKRRKKEGNLDHTNTNIQRNRITTPQTTCWAWSLLYPSPCNSHHLLLQKPTSTPLKLLSDPLHQLPFPVASSSTGQVQLRCSCWRGARLSDYRRRYGTKEAIKTTTHILCKYSLPHSLILLFSLFNWFTSSVISKWKNSVLLSRKKTRRVI